jgi:tetratricopeptide (TPR) repeat protein
MDLAAQLSSLFGKSDNYSAEYKKFKKSIALNPRDQGLKIRFIHFCLLNRFMKHETAEEHIAEALHAFEGIDHTHAFDIQTHYLVGKYYQEIKDNRRAYQVYLDAIKRFNRYVGTNPNLKSDNAESAYSIALNLMTLQSNPVDPELRQCFKILRKSYPLHLKRIELENEMSKPAPDPTRIWELKNEILSLKGEEESASSSPAQEKMAASSIAKPEEQEARLSPPVDEPARVEEKTPVNEPVQAVMVSPPSEPAQAAKEKHKDPKKEIQAGSKEPGKGRKKNVQTIELSPGDGENLDFLKLSPTFEKSSPDTFFMVYKDESWEGPYTPLQLSSKGFLKPETWVCRAGSQHVTQAYEVPDLLLLFK